MRTFFFFSKLLLFVPAGSKQYSASIAFTLALFSHLVNHVNIRLQAELEDAESQVPPLPTDAAGKIGRRLFFYVSKQGRDVRSCLQGPPHLTLSPHYAKECRENFKLGPDI